MNLIQMKINVDVDNLAQVEALNNLVRVVRETGDQEPKASVPAAQPAKKAPSRAVAKTEAPKAETVEQPSEEAKMTVVNDAQEVKPEAAAPNEDLLGGGQDAEPEVTLVDVRTLATTKIDAAVNKNFAANTEKLKAKLTELGAKNISSLEPKHFPAMLEFIKTLA